MIAQIQTTPPAILYHLVDTFGYNLEAYRLTKNETELRRESLDKFFETRGWDVYGLTEEEIRIVEGR